MQRHNTSWCLGCERQIILKPFIAPLLLPDSASSASSSPLKADAAAAHAHVTRRKTDARGRSVHGTGHIKPDNTIKHSNFTTAVISGSTAPTLSPPRSAIPSRHRAIIDQGSTPLYCSDECRISDLDDSYATLLNDRGLYREPIPAVPQPSREMGSGSLSAEFTGNIDANLIEWANSHLPAALKITDPNGSLCGVLAFFRLAESIRGKPSSPPVLDSTFLSAPNDARPDGLCMLFDFLLDNDVMIGNVLMNDVRHGKRDKIVQLLIALKAWDERKTIEQSIVERTLGNVSPHSYSSVTSSCTTEGESTREGVSSVDSYPLISHPSDSPRPTRPFKVLYEFSPLPSPSPSSSLEQADSTSPTSPIPTRISSSVATLAALYDFPPLPPPPPILEHADSNSLTSHSQYSFDQYQSGVMMAARRIKAALCPEVVKRSASPPVSRQPIHEPHHMALPSVQFTDARHSTFNSVDGNQYVYESVSSKDSVLEKLRPAIMDGSMRTECLEDTRTDVLTLIIDWACNPTSTQKAMWLHGPAGSGKSTISTTLAEHFRRLKQLGAFLFFDRDVTERSNPALVARTLAHQISLSHPEIGVFIISAIENSPQILVSPISSQFQEILIDPLSNVSTKAQIVLVLDALDECGTKTDRKALLNTLATQSAHLPSAFRLPTTSRPDIDMRLAFELQPHIKPFELDLTSAASYNDILVYIRHQMNSIRMKNVFLGMNWPGEKKIFALTRRACGLFVWASIVCNFIDAHDPRKRLDIVLQGNQPSTAEAALDTLYRTALEVLGVWDDDFVADFRTIIGIMLVLRNPLTTIDIDNLLANPDVLPSALTIEKLSCILSSKPTARFIHPSVADFFMNRLRCGRQSWFFTPLLYERDLAILCLHRLNQVLYRDMSQFALIVDRDDHTVPKDVAYACVFWVDHVCMVEDNLWLIEDLLETFIDQHILHWLEAMSLLQRSNLTITLLSRLSDWIQNHRLRYRQGLLNLVHQWWRFSQEYETSIRESPMQVYSEELLREFPFTQVQEPLLSRPPAPSIFDLPLFSQSSLDVSSPRNSSGSLISRPASPCPSDFYCSTPSASRSRSPDFTRFGRRLSRSSLDLPSHTNSSGSSMSQPASPNNTYFTGPELRPASLHHSSTSSIHKVSSEFGHQEMVDGNAGHRHSFSEAETMPHKTRMRNRSSELTDELPVEPASQQRGS